MVLFSLAQVLTSYSKNTSGCEGKQLRSGSDFQVYKERLVSTFHIKEILGGGGGVAAINMSDSTVRMILKNGTVHCSEVHILLLTELV